MKIHDRVRKRINNELKLSSECALSAAKLSTVIVKHNEAREARNGKTAKSAVFRERGAAILAPGLRPPGAGGPCTPNACGAKAGAPKTPECYDRNF